MKRVIFGGILVVAVSFVYMCLQPVFTADQPKRLYIQHTSRTVYDKDGSEVLHETGLWVNPFDSLGLDAIDQLNIPEFNHPSRSPSGCHADLVYCGLPWYFPISDMIQGGWWVPDTPDGSPSGSPALPALKLTVVDDTQDAVGARTIQFKGEGPSHLALVLKGPLEAWSITEDQIPYRGTASCGPECRWVFFAAGNSERGMGLSAWNFWIKLPAVGPSGTPSISLAFYGHAGLNGQVVTAPVDSIAAQLPDWVTLVSWGSTWHQYEF